MLMNLKVSSGVILATFEPKAPAHVLTPETLIAGAQATNCDLIWCVPAFIEVGPCILGPKMQVST